MNADKIADTILSWDTDDELSDEEEIYSGAVGGEEVVSPANIDIDSDSSKGKSDDDLNPHPKSSECLLDRDGTARKCSNPVSSGRAGAYNVITAKPEVPRDVASSRSPYDVWKHFSSEHILRMICRYTNEEAQQRGDEQFTVSLAELKTFNWTPVCERDLW